MRLTNKQYDTLKWVALVLIPCTVTLVLTVGKIWGIPYYDSIGATISALGIFLAGLIGISNKAYQDFVELQNAEEPADSVLEEEDGDEDE
jgi:hypothetical protein